MKKIVNILSWVLAAMGLIAAITVFVYVGKEVGKEVANEAINELTIEKENYENEVAELQEKSVSLQSTVDSLREELGIKYENNSERYEMEFRAEQMEWLIDAMPDNDPNAVDIIAKNLFDIGSSLIEYMGDAEFSAHNFVEPTVKTMKNGFTYSKCDISYSDAEKFYSGVFTETALKNFMRIRFTDVDGDLYAIPGGGSSGFGTEKVKLTRLYEKKNEIKYSVSLVHSFGYEEFREEVPVTCSMTIKLVNGGWRISEIDYMEHYWSDEELYWRTRTE